MIYVMIRYSPGIEIKLSRVCVSNIRVLVWRQVGMEFSMCGEDVS